MTRSDQSAARIQARQQYSSMGDQTSSSGCYGALVGCEHRPNGPALKPVTGFACFWFLPHSDHRRQAQAQLTPSTRLDEKAQAPEAAERQLSETPSLRAYTHNVCIPAPA